MKIITWNCNGALRRKLDKVDSFNADILVIQECENPEESTDSLREWAGDYLWTGENKNRGIGVFPKKGNTVNKLHWRGDFRINGIRSPSASLRWSTESLRLFLPFAVNEDIKFLGVWTKGSDSEAFGYMGQFWKFLQIHKRQLAEGNQVILGDFNSNRIWDKPDRWWNHTDVVNELEAIDLKSLYHVRFKEEQGEESTPTFFHHRDKAKPYHIDYVFVSKQFLQSKIIIGQSADWLALSDHMPLEIDLHG